jgi:hypothetical protein
MAPYLANQADFRRANLVLNQGPDGSDVLVQLSDGEVGSTRIVVSNTRTHESLRAASTWTLYPGMVALDVMMQVKRVCAPPVELVARTSYPRAGADGSNAYLRGFGVCSRTSWMKLDELDEAFRSHPEFPQHLVHVVAGCDLKGAALEVRHKASDPVEWQWQFKSSDGNVLAAGRVIGSSGRDAAGKIAEEVAGDVLLHPDTKLRAALDDGVENPWATESSSSSQNATVAKDQRPHGFKHVMGEVGWWSGQILVDAAYIAGYAAMGLAACAPTD